MKAIQPALSAAGENGSNKITLFVELDPQVKKAVELIAAWNRISPGDYCRDAIAAMLRGDFDDLEVLATRANLKNLNISLEEHAWAQQFFNQLKPLSSVFSYESEKASLADDG